MVQKLFYKQVAIVSYRDTHSANCSLTCGVPHGSVLGPLLFIIYTNDLPHSLTYSNCILFADDTTIYCTSNNKTTLQRNIENDMKSLAGWFYANKLSLNIKKNTFLVFSPKNMDKVMTAIKLGNQQILQVRNTKFLGIYIDDGLEWGDHINHITKKIASGADVLQAVKRYLSLDNMKSLNHSLVHSHLTYGTILWGSAFKYRLHEVEIFQKKAIRNNCKLYIMHRQLRFLTSWVILN